MVYALGCLHDAVENRDEKGMVKSLLRPQLMIRDVRKSVAPLYLSELLQAIDNKMVCNVMMVLFREQCYLIMMSAFQKYIYLIAQQ